MNKTFTLTIFTPTFNRKKTLIRLHESLLNQTSKDFIWLIVDDGSSDGTSELVHNFINMGGVKIDYYFIPNGGKQRAHNFAMNKLRTQLFLNVDSDDFLNYNSVESIVSDFYLIKTNPIYSGLVYLSAINNTPIHNNRLEDFIPTTFYDLYNGKNKVKGDLSYVFKKDVIVNFKFYVFDDEKFIAENYIYMQMDKEFKMIQRNLIIKQVEYLNDGYSKNIKKIILNNTKGYNLLKKSEISYSKKFLQLVRSSIGFNISTFIIKKYDLQSVNFYKKIIVILMVIPSFVYYIFFFKNKV